MFLAAGASSAAVESTSTVLVPSTNSTVLSESVNLTVTVSPSTSTGKVTFYDGTSILAIGTLTGGQVTLTTDLLAAGTHSLRAYYAGDANDSPSLSASAPVTVRALPASGFQPGGSSLPVGTSTLFVAVGDFNGDGIADLAATGYGSNIVSVFLGNGDGTFAPVASYAVGAEPYGVAVADFNGDGYPDLAVANGAGKSVSILLGNGNGTFQTSVEYPAGTGPRFVAVGDLNADGIADLAVPNYSSNNVSVLFGKGDGTFAAPVNYSAGENPQSAAIADFNGDGIPDLAVASSNIGASGKGGVSVLLGKGKGIFAASTEYPAGTNPISVAVGDFNDDGQPDIAAANYNGGGVSVLLNKGNGTFDTAVNYATDTNTTGVIVADMNGDGNPDLVVADKLGGGIGVLLANGNGTFQDALNYPGVGAYGLASGDFNRDGRTDLALADVDTGAVFVLLGSKIPTTITLTSSSNPSTLSQNVTLSAIVSPAAATGSVTFYDGMAVLDTVPLSGGAASFNNTLLPSGANAIRARYFGDATYLGSTASVTEQVNAVAGDGFQAPALYPAYTTGATPAAIAAADFNGDGIADLAVADSGTTYISILKGNGDGTFGMPAQFASGGSPVAITTGDFNGDGKTDLAVINSGPPAVSILLGNGDGTFQTAVNYGAGSGAAWVVAGDFNGDGAVDLATANSSGSVSILLGNGDGTFQTFVNYGATAGSNAVVAADFNNDGVADLATDAASVLLGNGDGTFQTTINDTVAGVPAAVVTGDFNRDGKADLAVANGTNISVLLGNGKGGFQTAVDYPVGVTATALVSADFNGDGKIDLAVAAGGGLLILTGNGDGTFATATPYTAGTTATGLVAGDFNGDGAVDLAVTGGTSDQITILIAQTPPLTTTTLISSLNPSTYGQSVSLTATVSPSSVIGSVTFYDGVGVLGSALVSGGQPAVFKTGLLASGSRALRAEYVANSTGAASSSGVVTQTVNPVPQHGFDFPVLSQAMTSGQAIALGDFNGDGKPDIATAGGDWVAIQLNVGDGLFSGGTKYLAGNGPTALAVGDFNGDGNTDVAVTNYVDYTVSILLGNGDGTLRPAVNFMVGAFPVSVAVGDFNGDGKADLAVATGNAVEILLGNGDGTFQPQITVNGTPNASSVAVGDFNGDGKPDLAFANAGNNNVSVLLGLGNGTFAAPVNYSVGKGPSWIVVGDINGDGKPDLMTANTVSGTVSVLLGNGDGTFAAALSSGAGQQPLSIAIGDFNGDGKPDLVVANGNSQNKANENTVSVLYGLGTGAFQSPVTYNTTSYTNVTAVATADFSGTGTADLTVLAGAIVVFRGLPPIGATKPAVALTTSLNPSAYAQSVILTATLNPSATGQVTFYDGANLLGAGVLTGGVARLTTSQLIPGTHSLTARYLGSQTYSSALSSALKQSVTPVPVAGFLAQQTFPAGTGAKSVVVSDFNQDGKLDLATLSEQGVGVLLGNGDGTFQPAVFYPVEGTALAVADFNGDGKPDLAAGGSILLGNGDGTFQPPLTSVDVGGHSMAVADFNGDGIPDIALESGTVSVVLGNGDGTFGPPQYVPSLVNAVGVTIADFNGDGIPDLAVAFSNSGLSGGYDILLGHGDGTFQLKNSVHLSLSPVAITVGDFNGDGKPDLAIIEYSAGSHTFESQAAVALGSGGGSFQTPVNYTLNAEAVSLATGDFNGDGKLDLAVGCEPGGAAPNNVTIFEGTGKGALGTPITYVTGAFPVSIASGDLNADGRLDIVTANNYDGTVSVLLGLGASGVTLKSSASSIVYGQPVTLTATVTPSTAAGTVEFVTGATPLGVAPVTAGQAAFTTTMLPFGKLVLNAVYTGDSEHVPSTSAALTQNVTSVAQGKFITASVYNVNGAGYVVTGDFNHDGIPDLAETTSTGVTVLLGNGDGTFQTPVSYATNTTPNALVVGDFNNDGKPDIIAVGVGQSILIGNGDGTFVPHVFMQYDGMPWLSIATGDFNGDGNTDIAAAVEAGYVYIGLGNGDGTFRSTGAGSENFAAFVAVADFNGDGKADLAVADSYFKNLSVMFGNGDGTFQNSVFYALGVSPNAIAVGDFNGDGKPDIAVTNYGPNGGDYVSVLLNKGKGAFAGAVKYPTGGSPQFVVTGDFNGDGIADLAVANSAVEGSVSILIGTGKGTFGPAVNYPTPSWLGTLATGDFDGDGRSSLAAAGNSITILQAAPAAAANTLNAQQ